jgi:hypothetical protein
LGLPANAEDLMNIFLFIKGYTNSITQLRKEKDMKKRYWLFAVVFVLLYLGVAGAQHPILDMVTNKVIQKYQNSTCEQLWQERAQQQGKPKPEREQKVIELLRGDAQLRTEFINRVAAPIANKMFECGMIP